MWLNYLLLLLLNYFFLLVQKLLKFQIIFEDIHDGCFLIEFGIKMAIKNFLMCCIPGLLNSLPSLFCYLNSFFYLYSLLKLNEKYMFLIDLNQLIFLLIC